MFRKYALGLRVVIVALLIFAASWGSLWTYVEYEAHRARLMLAEASSVRVGDSEAAVLPLVRRYSGFKWTAAPLGPKEDWIDKDEYDYQTEQQSDYKYELGISPFGTSVAAPTGRWTQALRSARERVPVHLRPLLGLRDWGTTVELSIRRGHVQSVSAMTLVQGHSQWLGYSWELAERMPRSHMPSRAYAIGGAHLTMADGGGEMIENYITPKASVVEVTSARQFNTGCLTSINGCDGLCNVAPRALEYLKEHPDVVWNIIPPKCH
jgi:hypothetical protein